MAARWRALPTQTEVKARTHHADPDRVSVADTDRNDPGLTVAPIKVESNVCCTQNFSAATGQGAQTELVRIVRALRGLDSHALRAFGAVISLLKAATAKGP